MDPERGFMRVNGCEMDGVYAASAYAGLVFVILAVYGMGWWQRSKAEQTATDYRVFVGKQA